MFCVAIHAECTFAQPYAGWERLAARLKSDGISETLVRSVYNGSVVPKFSFVPFRLKPLETHDMYQSFRTEKIYELAKLCRDSNAEVLKKAEKIFGVEAAVLTAIIVVESHCGRSTGKELIVNRLSRVSNIGEEKNIEENLKKLQGEDASVTIEQVEARAEYLEKTFYPQLLALFKQHAKGSLDIYSLRGSIAGAFGWPQFLPQTYALFATDGDRDGRISLFNPADAFFSVAHFFAAHGWKKSLSTDEKRKIIWNYNKSEPYIDTVLVLSGKI